MDVNSEYFLRRLTEIYPRNKKDSHMIFIALEKAWLGCLKIQVLWMVGCREESVHIADTRAIKNMYGKLITSLRTGKTR